MLFIVYKTTILIIYNLKFKFSKMKLYCKKNVNLNLNFYFFLSITFENVSKNLKHKR